MHLFSPLKIYYHVFCDFFHFNSWLLCFSDRRLQRGHDSNCMYITPFIYDVPE
uniref:Uncharacterized protein n=1 Tax=Arundo donax TaxID=35708 RepID=A0A0A9F7F7_ARUDO